MNTLQSRTAQTIVLVAAGIAVGAVVWATAPGWAEGELDTGPRVIPYTGALSYDGRPFNGQVDIQAIVRATDPDDGVIIAALTHNNVAVRQGAFHVNLGANQALPNALFTGSDVEVALFVAGVDEPERGSWLGAPTANEAFRPIRPHAFAYWAGSASDLHVRGDAEFPALTVARQTYVDTDTPLGVGTLLPRGAVSVSAGQVGGIEYQQLGDTAATMTRSGSFYNMNLAAGAGVRFKHGDNVLLEVTPDGFLPHRDVVVPAGSTLETLGELDIVEMEPEVTAQVTNGATDVELGQDTGRRFCFFTQLVLPEEPNGPDTRVRCHIESVRGQLRLSVFNNFQDGTETVCSARCVAW